MKKKRNIKENYLVEQRRSGITACDVSVYSITKQKFHYLKDAKECFRKIQFKRCTDVTRLWYIGSGFKKICLANCDYHNEGMFIKDNIDNDAYGIKVENFDKVKPSDIE